ncbi:hypothetical protein SGRI78S_02331 [Streptomyces griseus subsp. griseus]
MLHGPGRERGALRARRPDPLERLPGGARPRRARPGRRVGPGPLDRGPGALGRHGGGGVRLGGLLLPARRLRDADGGGRHRERAPGLHRPVREAGAYLSARPVLGRERRRQGRGDVRHEARGLRRGAADQRRPGRRFARLRLPGGPARGLPVLLRQPPASHRAAVPAVAGAAPGLHDDVRRAERPAARVHGVRRRTGRPERAPAAQPGRHPGRHRDPGAVPGVASAVRDVHLPRHRLDPAGGT